MLLEEANVKLLEARGRDPTNKRFQVGAITSEHCVVIGVCMSCISTSRLGIQCEKLTSSVSH
jgi:hypothetical protein